jgi:beta-glucanase (GH16 family)
LPKFLIVALGIAALVFFVPAQAQTVSYSFADEFDGDSLDASSWIPLNRGPDTSNFETQCYLATNLAVANGMLTISTDADPSGCSPFGNYSLSSGMTQWRSFNFLYGRLDVRAKASGGQGLWPAIWLLGTNCQENNPFDANHPDCNWPNPGAEEIDVAEFLDSDYTKVNQQIHTSNSNQGCKPSISDATNNWHVYSLDWQPGRLTWLVDDVVTCVIIDSVPSTPMFLIMNTAQGPAGGFFDPASLPVQFTID